MYNLIIEYNVYYMIQQILSPNIWQYHMYYFFALLITIYFL